MDWRSDSFPLMCGQRWLLHVLENAPEMARPVQRIYRLRSPLDTASLLRAYRHVIASNPSLRVQLYKEQDEWRQRFLQTVADQEIAGHSIRGRTPAARAAYAKDIFAQDSAAPLDLTVQAPIVARIIEIDQEYYFGVSVDHIVADESGFDNIERQLADAYNREVQCIEHADVDSSHNLFNYFHRELAQKPRESPNLDYWRDQLIGAPISQVRNKSIDWVSGRAARWEVSSNALADLNYACRAKKCSIPIAVVATLVRVLLQVGQRDDLVLNIPVSNRTEGADHGLIANLSTLLHVRFRDDLTALSPDYLRKIRDHFLKAMAHRYYDYGALSDFISSDATSRGGSARFDAGCSYVIEHQDSVEGELLFDERLDNQSGSNFDVPRETFVLSCRQSQSKITFLAEWDPEAWPCESEEFAQLFLELSAQIIGLKSKLVT
jgi:arthrofactin-type cyclic lipopeptide synthetase A